MTAIRIDWASKKKDIHVENKLSSCIAQFHILFLSSSSLPWALVAGRSGFMQLEYVRQCVTWSHRSILLDIKPQLATGTWSSGIWSRTLCVPKISSTSCDQVILVNQATDLSVLSDAVPVEVDGVG